MEQEHQRTEQERQRAEALAAQLRAAGIEPDTKLHSYVVDSFSGRPRVPVSPCLSQLLCLNATAYYSALTQTSGFD